MPEYYQRGKHPGPVVEIVQSLNHASAEPDDWKESPHHQTADRTDWSILDDAGPIDASAEIAAELIMTALRQIGRQVTERAARRLEHAQQVYRGESFGPSFRSWTPDTERHFHRLTRAAALWRVCQQISDRHSQPVEVPWLITIEGDGIPRMHPIPPETPGIDEHGKPWEPLVRGVLAPEFAVCEDQAEQLSRYLWHDSLRTVPVVDREDIRQTVIISRWQAAARKRDRDQRPSIYWQGASQDVQRLVARYHRDRMDSVAYADEHAAAAARLALETSRAAYDLASQKMRSDVVEPQKAISVFKF